MELASEVLSCFHWPFSPGVFIAILGGLAAVMTFWERPPILVEFSCVVLSFLLMLGEIWMISVDRNRHDEGENAARKMATQQVAGINALVAQGMAISSELSQIEVALANAKPEQVGDLNRQAGELRKQLGSIASQLAQYSMSSTQSAATTATHSTQKEINRYDQMSNVDLVASAKTTERQLFDEMQQCKAWLQDVEVRYDWAVYKANRPLSDEERQRWEEYREQGTETANSNCTSQSRIVFSQARDIRDTLIRRLTQKGVKAAADNKADSLFADLAANGARDCYDKRFVDEQDELSSLSSILERGQH